MKKVSVFLCSPRKGGVTDRLAETWGKAAASAGLRVHYTALREYAILPCAGCNACFYPPNTCVLANRDDTEKLFGTLLESALAVFASPVYFYALPAHFKAFIDRAQRFWAISSDKKRMNLTTIPGLVIMAAGRPRGEKLFSGSLRTLRWFGRALNLEVSEDLTFRGLDQPADLEARPEIRPLLEESAKRWGTYLAASTESSS